MPSPPRALVPLALVVALALPAARAYAAGTSAVPFWSSLTVARENGVALSLARYFLPDKASVSGAGRPPERAKALSTSFS